jgi:hypothetical protein
MTKKFDLNQLGEMYPALDNLRFATVISDAASTTLSKHLKSFKATIDARQALVTAVLDRYKDQLADEQPDVPEDQRVLGAEKLTAMRKEMTDISNEEVEVEIFPLKRSDFPKTPKEFGMRKRNVTGQDGTSRLVENNYYENYVILRGEIILPDDEHKKLTGPAEKAAKGQNLKAV